jgi:MoaA/NifB/PqqE/SkfB family radical SAM enzyme
MSAAPGAMSAAGTGATMRERLAHLLTRRLYRGLVVRDRPRSDVYYALKYGTWAKLVNYLRMRRDYHLMRTTVSSEPYIVRIEPISACNLRCPLCATGAGEIDREARAMTAETLDAILARCGRHALYANMWVWGEPMLNRRLADLVAVCKRRGVGSEVSSHLSLPLSQERIDELITSGLDWLIVSNDAATAATYEKYRIGGSFERVIKNLKAIVARKRALGSLTPFVEWQVVPLRHNEHELGAIERLASEIGVDGVRVKLARLDRSKDGGVLGRISDERIAKWAPSNPRLSHLPRPGRDAFIDFHCRFLWGMVTVYADGAMAPCCETTTVKDDLGNIFKSDFDAIWNGPSYIRARRIALGLAEGPEEKATACHACMVFHKPLAPKAGIAARERPV